MSLAAKLEVAALAVKVTVSVASLVLAPSATAVPALLVAVIAIVGPVFLIMVSVFALNALTKISLSPSFSISAMWS